MLIAFNAKYTNLGNTGGCRTIVKSAEALKKMGHEVVIVAKRNRYTWEKIETVNKIPVCDLCIAVSVLDVDSTRSAKAKYRIWWMRGYEKWLAGRDEIKRGTEKLRTFANSQWLADRFKCELLYSGLDLDFWKNLNTRTDTAIGCLYSHRNTKRYQDAKRLMHVLGEAYTLKALGRDGPVLGQELIQFYNDCDFWFSPSILEGFHNPPAEAMLCGCLPIVTGEIRGGTSDYVIQGKTGLRYLTVEGAAEYITTMTAPEKEKMVAAGWELLKTKIGTREQNMAKLLEAL